MAATIVSGLPSGLAGVSNADVVGIHVRRIDVEPGCRAIRLWRAHRGLGGFIDLAIHVCGNLAQLCLGRRRRVHQERRERGERIARRFRRPLRRRLVRTLIVRVRMGIRANHRRVHERRTASIATPRWRFDIAR